MNIYRGLFRLWIMMTVVWVIGAAYTNYVDCNWYNQQVVCFDDLIPFYRPDYRLAWVTGPPLAVLLVGLGIIWCIRGFRAAR